MHREGSSKGKPSGANRARTTRSIRYQKMTIFNVHDEKKKKERRRAGNLTRLFSITENPPPFSGATMPGYDDRSYSEYHVERSRNYGITFRMHLEFTGWHGCVQLRLPLNEFQGGLSLGSTDPASIFPEAD